MALNNLPRQYATEGIRPQTLIFTLLGRHVLSRADAVASSTFLEVLGRLDISVQAARSTLTRMVRRGHLVRHPVGRRAYFSISEPLESVLREGGDRIFEPPVGELPEDVWTLLSFSIPEEQRADRHSLRTALAWNGFGLLRNGLWIAPGEVDVGTVVEKLGDRGRIEVFSARPAGPTDLHGVVQEAWDFTGIAERYRDFMARWEGDLAEEHNSPLAAQILLITEWQQILVDDPELSLRYLPDDWPALDAFELFVKQHDAVSADAEQEFADLLDTIEVPKG